MRKELVVFLSACMLACSLTGCGGNSSKGGAATEAANTEKAGKDGKRTYLAFGAGTAQEMSPFTSSSAGNMTFRTLVYMQLAYDDGKGWLVSDAAEKIEMEDEYNFRIKLYEGIRDTNGNAFTADDLVFCMNKIKEIGKISYYSTFESVKKEDDYTVLVTLNSNLNTAFIDLCNNTLLVTQKSYEESADEMKTTPVGTTQYKVTEFVPSSYVLYERTDDYWQTDASKITRAAEANVDVIKITMLKETTQKVSGLQTGDLQLANNLTYLNTTTFNGNSKYRIFDKLNIATCDNLVFNMTENGVCADDLNLRKAVLYAIDNEAILAALGGQGEAMKAEVSSQYIGFNEDWLNEDYFDYNPELAKEYLAKSGYSGQTLRLLNSTDTAVKTRNEVILANLQAAGIKCELNTQETAVYQSSQYASHNEYDIAAIGIGANDFLISDAYVKVGSDTTSDVPGTTKFGWDNKEFIEMCNQVAVIGNQDAGELVEKIHDMAVENAVMKGLVVYAQYNVCVDTITDLFSTRSYVRANATHFAPEYDVFYNK